MSNKSKKGQSLVEVVVALSILIIVLTSTVTLVISSVNLVLSSRTRTQAISIAQKGLADGLLVVRGTCQIKGTPSSSTNLLSSSNQPETITTNNVEFKLTVTMRAIDSNKAVDDGTGLNAVPDLNSYLFNVVVAKVVWTDKGKTKDSSSYELSQMVRVDK